MKSKMPSAQKNRWIAGALYIVLAVYQVFTCRGTLMQYTAYNADLVRLIELLIIPGAAAMAIWMFAGKKAISPGMRRAVVTGTLVVILYQLITYPSQAAVIQYSFSFILPGLFGKDGGYLSTWLYIAMIIRLVLMIFGAFFITNSRNLREEEAGSAPAGAGSTRARTPEEQDDSRAIKPAAPAAEAKETGDVPEEK